MSNQPGRIYTDHGMIKDVEANLLKLCRQAWNEPQYLRFNAYRPSDADFVDGDIVHARLENLPVLYVWVSEFSESPNETGAMEGHTQRHLDTFRVAVVYATHSGLPKEGQDAVKAIGWLLKEKLTEETDLNGLMNFSGMVVSLDFDPELIIHRDKLCLSTSARLILEYKRCRSRRRTTR